MKNLKMKFLCWKESVRKWCIKKLGGYLSLRELYYPSIFNEERGEVAEIVCKCLLSYSEYLEITKAMGSKGTERFIKEKIYSDMFEKLDKLNFFTLYKSNEEESDIVVYKLVLRAIKPQ